MIPYYNPHFRLWDLFKAPFQINAEKKISRFFNQYSKKKYILFTSSGRVALYLAYQALNKKGGVITSPLTCQSAIEPIIWSGNVPVFVDIDLETLNMNPQNIEPAIQQDVIAAQLINHGGLRIECEHFHKNQNLVKLKIIEDCAQSFGQYFDETNSTIHSDVACYSLIKTGYGLGGGILATNDKEIYAKALAIQQDFPAFPIQIIIFRIVKQLLESHRKLPVIEKLYQRLIALRRHTDYPEISIDESKTSFFKKPPLLFKLYFASRLTFMQSLQKIRHNKGKLFTSKLLTKELMQNYRNLTLLNSTFTKLFLYHPKIKSETCIPFLNSKGIETKHLEHKASGRIQPQFDCSEIATSSIGIEACKNYFEVHDHLISLPLTEDLKEDEMDKIVRILDEYIN
jgi:dTDP-4-amino-4,6-dideoxygalactose transaminase